MADCLVKCDENMKAGDAVEPYQEWCSANGYGALNKGNFFDELRGRAFSLIPQPSMVAQSETPSRGIR